MRDRGFTDWLRRQAHRDDGVGDLARDVVADLRHGDDERWPRGGDLEACRRYLVERDACEGALQALERAWSEWLRAEARARVRAALRDGWERQKRRRG